MSDGASIPQPGWSMEQHTTSSEGGNALLSCMFCNMTFARKDDLDAHLFSEYTITSPEPNVLVVEAEFKLPEERPRLPVEQEEVLRCILCGHIAQDASELGSHVKKHKEYYTYFCKICGRRFKEARYLKNHMKKHPKEGGKVKGQQEVEPPVTINGVPQEPSEPVDSPYKMCLACGFHFPDQETLDKHSKVHNRQVEPDKGIIAGASAQDIFLGALTLQPFGSKRDPPERTSTWIPQLNPFVTHQAWNLATTGKLAVGVKNPKAHSASKEKEARASDEAEGKGQGGQPLKEVAGKEQRPQKTAAQTHRRPPIQKVKERQTTCEVCAKTFGTYQQLTVHSRVHKSKKDGEEKQPKTASPPEKAVQETLASGEKPYKCVHCDYAAARKTSLNGHLKRRHNDLHLDQPLDLSVHSPTKRKLESEEGNPEFKRRRPRGGSPDGRFNSVCGRFDNPPVFEKMEYNTLSPNDDGLLTHPSPAHWEKVDIQSEISDAPLNLSLTTPASAEYKIDEFPFACPHCQYTCIIKRKLTDKDKPDATKRSRFGSNTNLKRSTGCPPALDGKGYVLIGDKRFTRRTWSPPPPPAKRQKLPVNPLTVWGRPLHLYRMAHKRKYAVDQTVTLPQLGEPNPMTGMSVRTLPRGTGLPTPPEALGACTPLGAGLDSECGVMNPLQPDTPGDLAARLII